MEAFNVLKRGFRLTIAIPASLVSDVPHLREKTVRIGMVGRAAAIFRVDEIIVYSDRYGVYDRVEEATLIRLILSYMETPQYLRKKLFGLQKSLKYAGVLPPLRTPHHPLTSRTGDLIDGELREALVVEAMADRCLVDVGVEVPVTFMGKGKVGQRLTVKVLKSEKGVLTKPITPQEDVSYRGYRTTYLNKSLGEVIDLVKADLVLATSKYGKPLLKVSQTLTDHLRAAGKVLVLFGSPREGLKEILKREGLTLEALVDFTINTVPRQGTETVRTEEAIYASLTALNLLLEE